MNTLLLVLAFIVIALISFLVFYYLIKQQHNDSLVLIEKKDKVGLRQLKKDLNQQHLSVHNILMSKWVAFGGGFYGLMAVLTYVLVEVIEIIDFLSSESGILATIAALGFGDLVRFLINSIMNFVTAITWPVYWMNRVEGHSFILWFLVVYMGYLTGQFMAKNAVNPFAAKP